MTEGPAADEPEGTPQPLRERATSPLAVFIGPPGSGKSSVARAVAKRLGVAHRDTDDDVVTSTGRDIPAIFAAEGEEAFRRLEATAVIEALARHTGVVSLGGGAPMTDTIRSALHRYRDGGGVVVFFDLTAARAGERMGHGTGRPLLEGDVVAKFDALMTVRRPVYEELASITINTAGLGQLAVTNQVISELRKAGAL